MIVLAHHQNSYSLALVVSVGTFAVTCIMTGKVVSEHSVSAQEEAANRTDPVLDPVLVATTVTLAVGIIQVPTHTGTTQMAASREPTRDYLLVRREFTGCAAAILSVVGLTLLMT